MLNKRRFTAQTLRNNPASAALIRLLSAPATSARRPRRAMTGRWLGARPPATAIWIAIELKFAKPHSANVTIATVGALRPFGRRPGR